jgi:hypothetical protein
MTDIKAFNPNKQTTYHGSPYDFAKFSNEAIGTGEGNQVHGYGHYTAKSKKIADERYRKRLSSGDYEIAGQKLDDPFQEATLREVMSKGKSNVMAKYEKDLLENKKIIDDFENQYSQKELFKNDELYLPYSNAQDNYRNIQERYDFIKNIDENAIRKNEGQLYKLSIPKDDVMLREGATFAEQPVKVQSAIKEIIKENPELSELIDTRTSDELFDLTEKAIGKQGKNIMKEIFQAELSGDENKIMNAWDRYNSFEQKNNLSSDIFNPDIVYSYLNNYKSDGIDDVGKIFANQHSNTNLYKYLEDERNFNKRLYDKGIKGISYNGGIDGEARVIFNPDDIDIVRKYYNQPSLAEFAKKYSSNMGAISNSLIVE